MKFGVRISDADLTLLHQRCEGWPAVLQMAALSLRGTTDPERLARVLEVRGQAIAEYFVSEVLEQQPAEVAEFMLDTSILGVLTEEACAARPGTASSSRVLTEPLTAAEQRILTLLPTSTYLQIADRLYVSRNTVKTHLRSIYQKLGVASRSEALERAVDLRLL